VTGFESLLVVEYSNSCPATGFRSSNIAINLSIPSQIPMFYNAEHSYTLISRYVLIIFTSNLVFNSSFVLHLSTISILL
jgi:hypothetical protein